MTPAAKRPVGAESEELRYRQKTLQGQFWSGFPATFASVGEAWLEKISDREQEEAGFVLGLSLDRCSEIEPDGNRHSTE